MFHRTYGETKDCKGCRYWSEMIAAYGGGHDGAMCLAPDGPKRQKYMSHWMTCDHWKSGHHGAVDEPSENGYGGDTMPLYEAEEAATR